MEYINCTLRESSKVASVSVLTATVGVCEGNVTGLVEVGFEVEKEAGRTKGVAPDVGTVVGFVAMGVVMFWYG